MSWDYWVIGVLLYEGGLVTGLTINYFLDHLAAKKKTNLSIQASPTKPQPKKTKSVDYEDIID